MNQNRQRGIAALLAMAALAAGTGCRVENRDHQGAEGKDVSIDTPLGGLHVKGDPGAVLAKVGLPAYPGAQPMEESSDRKHSADVNLSFGSFKLQVLATGLQTTDSPSQVESFYRKALSQYSDVIACRNQKPVGSPVRTGMGLTCSEDSGKKSTLSTHTEGDELKDALVLKAGSPSRQHMVAITPRLQGSRMELISLELPHGDSDD